MESLNRSQLAFLDIYEPAAFGHSSFVVNLKLNKQMLIFKKT